MPQQLCPVVVGRTTELDALRGSLASTAAGQGGCALLVGEPGIGKSRLAREALSLATERGLATATGRAVPSSVTTAYRPIIEALLQLLRDRPLPGDPGLAPWLAALRPLVPALPEADEPAAEASPAVRGEALLQLLRRVCPSGALFVLEDLHWADPDTVDLVEYLADNASHERLMLVLTLRDGPPSAALDMALRHRATRETLWLRLERLSSTESEVMVRACNPDVAEDVLDRVRQTAEGVPLLVEELLASPGLPETFAATVSGRLDGLDHGTRDVIEVAAVLGRHFDWALLPAICARDEPTVADALAAGVACQLLASQGGQIRFRHALTREAVIDTILPPRQRQLAAAALAVLLESHPRPDGDVRERAIDLAVRAGDRHRAGTWLVESGRQSLGWGALSSAADAMGRAAGLLEGSAEQAQAELGLVAALALAGRVEDAAAAGARLVTRLGDDEETAVLRVQAHLEVARAAIAASRWQMARHQLDAARRLAGDAPAPELSTGMDVLEADVRMAEDDYDAARQLAEEIIRADGATAETRCHALEIIGRTRRSVDLVEARRAFDAALTCAESAGLALWRLRALHELGTIDLFDHAGADRLLEARAMAERTGALSTAAVLDLQLGAAFTCRWDLEACDVHAQEAIEIGERLGLDLVKAKALALLAGSASMRADLEETTRYAELTIAAAPGDRMLEGFCLGARGVALLLAGKADAAMEPYGRGMAVLNRLPHAEPAAKRALWPLVLAARDDRRAQAALDEANRLGVGTFGLNRALLGYGEAVLCASGGDHRRARALVAGSDPGFVNCRGWADLARLLAAPSALAGEWADARTWLVGAARRFVDRGLPALAARCETLVAGGHGTPWADAGVTAREADVLRLVGEGLANKEIAARLHLSPRTVEKHVESLFRKTGCRSRTELAARFASSTGTVPTT